MIKHYCDDCGRELTKSEAGKEFKRKEKYGVYTLKTETIFRGRPCELCSDCTIRIIKENDAFFGVDANKDT